jgi:Uma2 family endonuclease
MATVMVDQWSLRIPAWVQDLESLRRWADTDEFPEKGRVCWILGEVWADMSTEQIYTHNQVKQAFNLRLGGFVEENDLGLYFPDGVLLSNEAAELASRPDAIFTSHEALESRRVAVVEGRTEGHVELEGSPDMVLEVVSTSSVKKDTETLRELYWKANIREYWLVDARGEKIVFEILRQTARGYVATKKQDGWLKSAVFGRSFRLLRELDRRGDPKFTLAIRP